MTMIKGLLLWLYFVWINVSTSDSSDLIVVTENGRVRGKLMQTVGQNKTFRAFRGIPYAKPPLGELRFKDPQPAEKWNEVLDATQDKSECVQSVPVEGSEDCLYINVYVPKVPSGGEKLPVMVWMYGGRFVGGSSDYDSFGPDHLLDRGVAFVSFNYRLGIFGFLSTGDMAAPGNAALKDQVLALKWVRANVARFGGDPANVTIFGESAGAASVSLHLQSPLSKGLFQRAIMQSGTSLCLWTRSTKAKKYAESVGKLLSVKTSTSQALVDGLRSVPYKKLQEMAKSRDDWMLAVTGIPTNGMISAPVIEPDHDGAFFSKKSHELLKTGKVNRVPVIIGFNSLEGYFDIPSILGIYFGKYDINHSDLVPIDMNITNKTIRDDIGEKIKDYYSPDSPLAFNKSAVIEYVSDDQFNRPIRETVLEYSKYATVYYYLFSYEGKLGVQGEKRHKGVQHTEDLYYLFRSDTKPTALDELTRLRMTTMWTNFAKHGNPTPVVDPLFNNVTWTETRSRHKGDDLVYLNIGEKLKLELNPKEKAWSFWEKLFKSFGKGPYDTY